MYMVFGYFGYSSIPYVLYIYYHSEKCICILNVIDVQCLRFYINTLFSSSDICIVVKYKFFAGLTLRLCRNSRMGSGYWQARVAVRPWGVITDAPC